jgi:hypothetical protein
MRQVLGAQSLSTCDGDAGGVKKKAVLFLRAEEKEAVERERERERERVKQCLLSVDSFSRE